MSGVVQILLGIKSVVSAVKAFTMTSATSGTATGFVSGTVGSASPTALWIGTLTQMYTKTGTGSFTAFAVSTATNPGATAFTSISVTGTSTATLTASAATYSYTGGVATWEWVGTLVFNNGSYTITIT